MIVGIETTDAIKTIYNKLHEMAFLLKLIFIITHPENYTFLKINFLDKVITLNKSNIQYSTPILKTNFFFDNNFNTNIALSEILLILNLSLLDL